MIGDSFPEYVGVLVGSAASERRRLLLNFTATDDHLWVEGDHSSELCTVTSNSALAVAHKTLSYTSSGPGRRLLRCCRVSLLPWHLPASQTTRLPGQYKSLTTLFVSHARSTELHFILKVVATPPTSTRAERKALLARALESVDDYEQFLRDWFRGAPLRAIYRENFRSWLVWAVFGTEHPADDAVNGWAAESEEYIQEVERRTGWTFPDGYNEKMSSMRLSADPLRILSRPLLLYIVSAVLSIVSPPSN